MSHSPDIPDSCLTAQQLEDQAAFSVDGKPLHKHHIVSHKGLSLILPKMRRVFAREANIAAQGTERPEWQRQHDLITRRQKARFYTLPPHYFVLRLHWNFSVHSNDPEHNVNGTYLHEIGEYTGALVAAHHIGLNLSSAADQHIYVSTLRPNARDTAPVVIGMEMQHLENRLGFGKVRSEAPTNLLDPTVLFTDQKITTEPPPEVW